LGKISLILLLVGLVVAAGPYKETTEFWSKIMDRNLSYRAFAGYEEIDWYYKTGDSGMFYQLYTGPGINPRV